MRSSHFKEPAKKVVFPKKKLCVQINYGCIIVHSKLDEILVKTQTVNSIIFNTICMKLPLLFAMIGFIVASVEIINGQPLRPFTFYDNYCQQKVLQKHAKVVFLAIIKSRFVNC